MIPVKHGFYPEISHIMVRLLVLYQLARDLILNFIDHAGITADTSNECNYIKNRLDGETENEYTSRLLTEFEKTIVKLVLRI